MGLLLRWWNLPDQILGGDELHAVRAAVRYPLARIVRTYSQADPCIPLASFYHLVIDYRGYLDEAAVRLPSMLSGLLALLLIPLLAWRRVGGARAQLLAWMVAISPLMVLYSRLARPYMPIVLLAFVAFMAFDRWVEGGQKRWAALWAVSSGLAVWFHLVTAPFVLSPWLFEVVRKVLQRRPGASQGRAADRGASGGGSTAERPLPWPALVGFGLLAAVVIMALIGPALGSLIEVLASKEGGSRIDGRALLGVWYLQAGTASALLSVLFWGLALVGLVRLFARQKLFAARGLVAVVAQVAVVWALSPKGVAHPLVLNRYWLVGYPIVLCWWVCAFPFGAGDQAGRDNSSGPIGPLSRGVTLAAVAMVLLLLVRGPLLSRSYATSSFTQSNDYVAFYQPAIEPIELPSSLADLPEPGPLLVFPWPSRWRLNRGLAVQQQSLGRSLVVASPERPLSRPPLHFRNLSAADPRAFLASRGRYLAVYLDFAAEERRPVHPEGRSIFRPDQAERYRRQARQMVRLLKEQWGEPMAQDVRAVVWDLDAVRSGLVHVAECCQRLAAFRIEGRGRR